MTPRTRHALAWLATAWIAASAGPARAGDPGPLLHEPIPPDAAEDLAMHVVLPGNLPPAIKTSRGQVAAPDPGEPPSAAGSAYAPSDSVRFHPDRDTRRPSVPGYDDPFTPSTAPFKRLSAFDAIRSDFTLDVRDPRQVALTDGPAPGPDDDSFYGDLVVTLTAGQRTRIPSVGPGARIVHARLGVLADDLPFRVFRDGADNWFLEAGGPASGLERRARLVMELAIPRRAFGGAFNDPEWSDLPLVPPLPDSIAREAAVVRAAIGVSRQMRPREAVARLVQYFRSFVDSNEPPHGRGSVYLDLALSKKGVCRHRAFALLVTAQSLGIPTRMVVNEAHAWVEAHDGALYRRIDLGGAGHMDSGPLADRAIYDPPADAFRWPVGTKRGEDMVAEASGPAGGGASGSGVANGTAGASSGASYASSTPGAMDAGAATPMSAPGSSKPLGGQPGAVVRFGIVESSPHRGEVVHLRGTVTGTGAADGQACDHATVELRLTALGRADAVKGIRLGSLATDDHGVFEGALVIPADAPLGDYDVVATSSGGGRCSDGDTP